MAKSSFPLRRTLAAAALSSMLAAPVVWAASRQEATPVSLQAPPSQSDYLIGPDDTLDVEVFDVKELSGVVQVDSGGKILLPLVGQVTAAGQTPDQLSKEIAADLGKKYLKDPQVTVTVKDSTSQKITIDGAVTKPGVYPLTGPTTLMQAVSLAQGPDPKLANTSKVEVFRMVDGRRVGATYNLNSIRSGKSPDPPVYAKDIVTVATSGGKSFMQTWGSALPLLAWLHP